MLLIEKYVSRQTNNKKNIFFMVILYYVAL